MDGCIHCHDAGNVHDGSLDTTVCFVVGHDNKTTITPVLFQCKKVRNVDIDKLLTEDISKSARLDTRLKSSKYQRTDGAQSDTAHVGSNTS